MKFYLQSAARKQPVPTVTEQTVMRFLDQQADGVLFLLPDLCTRAGVLWNTLRGNYRRAVWGDYCVPNAANRRENLYGNPRTIRAYLEQYYGKHQIQTHDPNLHHRWPTRPQGVARRLRRRRAAG